MKDSGIEWIGEIPESWTFIKGKFLFTERNERGNKNTLQLLSPTQKYGVIPQSLYEELSGMKAVKLDEKTDYNTMKSIYNGDFCISLRSFQGGFEYSEYDGVVSPAYHVFYKTEDLCNAYYRYLFKEQGFISKMASLTKTFRDGKSIAFTDFADSLIPVPPLPEQQAISAYLDRQCGLIDSVIEKTKASVEEYKKLRQAVITQAVTKGVRGDRPMKDSGIDAVQTMPSDWQRYAIKHLVSRSITDGTHMTPDYSDYEHGVPFLSSKDISSGVIDWSDIKYITKELHEELYKSVAPQTGDILLAKNGTTGIAAIVEENKIFDIYVTIALIRAKEALVFPKFLLYSVNSLLCKRQFDEQLKGIGVPNLHLGIISNTKVFLPDLNEQKEIAAYLDKKCTEIDTLITKKETFLTELESYKKSMIYEYVTGKKEVPQA